MLDAIAKLIDSERLGAVATVVAGAAIGDKALLDAEDGIIDGSLPEALIPDVLADAAELMDREQNRTLSYGDADVFIETLAPPPRLLVFGAVHIAQELATLAKQLEFHVTVSDARAAFTTDERFPNADEILVGWPEDIADQLRLDRRTYVVILSHDARFEDPVYPMLHESQVRYIGAMGSRRTHANRLERLGADGWSMDDLDRIHGPVGIDIGAETPAEVAVSIMAEMIQVRYGVGTGLSLRGREGRIHLQRTDDEGDI